MTGIWIPIIVIVLSSGSPAIVYDSESVYSDKQVCMEYNREVVSAIPKPTEGLITSISFDCLFIPDNRGI